MGPGAGDFSGASQGRRRNGREEVRQPTVQGRSTRGAPKCHEQVGRNGGEGLAREGNSEKLVRWTRCAAAAERQSPAAARKFPHAIQIWHPQLRPHREPARRPREQLTVHATNVRTQTS